MDAWIYVAAAAAITVAPAVTLTLLCRTEARGDELLPRWAKARSIVRIALGGAAAVALLPERGRTLLQPRLAPRGRSERDAGNG